MQRRWLAALVATVACQQRSPLDALVHARDLAPVAIPSDDELRAELAEAVAKKHRDLGEREIDAVDPGEAIEHATLNQIALDTRHVGLDELLRVGDDLFAYQFRPENGLGNGQGGPAPNLRRVHLGDRGGPDALACADCHSQGGDDGAGALTQNTFFRGDGARTRTADVRNPPALLGLGPIQALAAEMSAELAAARASAVERAAAEHRRVAVELRAKGVAFGTLAAASDGTLDVSGVRGVSPDLVVRPFGWKGHRATLRDMVRESFRVHLGVIAMVDQERVRDHRTSPAADDGDWYDLDRDGVTIELDDGMLSTMVAYLAQLEVPVVQPPADPVLHARFARGQAELARAGCTQCHVPVLPLDHPTITTRAEEPEHAASAPVAIDVAHDGRAPKIARGAHGYDVPLYSDLCRHDLGDALAAPVDQPSEGGAIAARAWLTRPLWGLADTAPYLHDGRAPTIDDAIRLHGGEAAAARDAYVAMSPDERADLRVFLTSLARVRRLVAP